MRSAMFSGEVAAVLPATPEDIPCLPPRRRMGSFENQLPRLVQLEAASDEFTSESAVVAAQEQFQNMAGLCGTQIL